MMSVAKSSSAWASEEKFSTKGTATSIAATSAPLRSATRETRPRWSMCWWVRITSSMSSSRCPRPAIPRCSSSKLVPELGPASTRVSGSSSIRYTFTRPTANGVGMARRWIPASAAGAKGSSSATAGDPTATTFAASDRETHPRDRARVPAALRRRRRRLRARRRGALPGPGLRHPGAGGPGRRPRDQAGPQRPGAAAHAGARRRRRPLAGRAAARDRRRRSPPGWTWPSRWRPRGRTPRCRLATGYARAFRQAIPDDRGLPTRGIGARAAEGELGPVGWGLIGAMAGLGVGVALALLIDGLSRGSGQAPRRSSRRDARARRATRG